MSKVEDDLKVLIVPTTSTEESTDDQSNNYDGSKQIRCLMPCSVECMDNLDFDSKKIISRQGEVNVVYNLESDLDLKVKLAYENQLHKYMCLLKYGDRYQGVIRDEAARILSSTSKVINDSVVVGGESWRRQQAVHMTHRLEQLGAISLFISISFVLSRGLSKMQIYAAASIYLIYSTY